MKKALITGISGQDGSYLAEHLLEQGYEVFGTVRRNSTPEHQTSRLDPIMEDIRTFYADLSDCSAINRIVQDTRPDEIYNTAAQSHVRISFEIPQFTVKTNALGVLNMLEAYKEYCPESKFYQASSSEMFGLSVDPDGAQRESTTMNPVSPYGCSKVFGYNIVRNYRRAYKLHATNGILFNHESPRRASNFVTNKVVKAAVRIKLGLQDKLELGNMDSHRDWGHSYDYVRAMHLMLQQPEPGDWVVATGEARSVRQMCDYVFSSLGLNYQDYVVQNPKYLRPEELPYLRGDSTKIRDELGWKPKYTFEMLMDEMAEHWMQIYKA